MTLLKNLISLKSLLILVLIVLSLIFWPTSFLQKNETTEALKYFTPNLFLIVTAFQYLRQNKYWYFALLPIGLIIPQLSIFVLVFAILVVIFIQRDKYSVLLLILSLVIFGISSQSLYSNSVFINEEYDKQQLIQKANIYHEAFPAKLLQNEGTLIWDKYQYNLAILLDPNTYFFGMHPREEQTSQNLYKYSFIFIAFFILGFFNLLKYKIGKYLLMILPTLIISLAFLNNVNLYDSILFFPISLVIVLGIISFWKLTKKQSLLYLMAVAAIFIASFDYFRLIMV